MHPIVRFARRAATPALIAITLGSCEDNRITTAPHRPLLADVTVPPPAGSYDLPDPTNSGGDGSAVPERETGITIPEGDHYVRVRVTGGILISTTYGDDAINGYTVGPWGLTSNTPFPYCEYYTDFCTLQVVPRLNTPTGGWGFIFNDMGNYVGESVVLVTGPGSFTIERRGLSCAGDEGNCFDFSGHQTLSVDFVALAVHASSTTPAPGEVVHFQAEGVNVTLGLPAEWQFRPTGAADYIAVPACVDHLECDFAPPSHGVMFAQSWVGSGFVGGEVEIGQPAVTIKMDTVYGPNPNGSFTTRAGEQQITLEATVTPAALAASVRWSVVPAPEAAAETQAPATIPPGATSGFPVPAPAPGRWQAYGHPGDLNVKRLGYEATATVSSGGTQYQSTPPPTRVYQDEVDVAREEYVELGVSRGVPARGVFGAHFGNRGDYGVAVINPDFDRSFVALELQWSPSILQVNSLYRNPVHNRWHVPGAANSLHQYGCAADLQTFPVLANPAFPPLPELQKAQNYWDLLRDAAVDAGFDVEQRDPDPATPQQASSGVGHVHIETECI
ncbi:MAG TPA: hypothetical protein VN953_01330 [Gemmatimonadales bacterium]|nr:hypothetical protein [Gemmatimonadales bacterium]